MADQPTRPTGGYRPPPPRPGSGYPAPRTDQRATLAVIVAATGFTTCPPLAAVVALVLASSAEQRIAASGGWLTGGGALKAARILAYVQLGLAGLVFITLTIAFVVGLLSQPEPGFDPTMTSLQWLPGHSLRVP